VTAATLTRARGLFSRGKKPKAKAKPRRTMPVQYSVLLTATLCLVAFGVVMVFSASSTTSLLGESGDSAYYLKRTLIFGAIGLVALKVLSVHGVKLVRPLTGALLAAGFVLLVVVHIPGVGIEANGATRWIGFGFFQVQPAEIMKIALILYGAHLFATRPKITGELRTLMPYLAVVGSASALIVFEPDLGTAMIAAFSVGTLLIAAGVPLRQIGLIGGVCAGCVLLMILIEPYRMERLTGFLNPAADPEGTGFQITQASIALGSGGFFGVGLGESVQ
jgi:cell division protein FtsW